MPPTNDPAAQQQFFAAMGTGAPHIYANGFFVAQSLSDIAVVLQANGSTVTVLNISFTSAKSLAQQLQTAVDDFETATGQKLLTMAEINEKTFVNREGG